MKKPLFTCVLSLVVAIILWAQPKKPTSSQAKKTGATQGVKPAAQAKTSPVVKASIARGKEVYTRNCMACHQNDGGGVARLNPPLIKTTYVLGDKAELIKIVLKGLNQPIEIDDEEYTNAMPGQPHLTDQEVADVLTFVRNSFGNKASTITVAEVKTVRAKTK